MLQTEKTRQKASFRSGIVALAGERPVKALAMKCRERPANDLEPLRPAGQAGISK